MVRLKTVRADQDKLWNMQIVWKLHDREQLRLQIIAKFRTETSMTSCFNQFWSTESIGFR